MVHGLSGLGGRIDDLPGDDALPTVEPEGHGDLVVDEALAFIKADLRGRGRGRIRALLRRQFGIDQGGEALLQALGNLLAIGIYSGDEVPDQTPGQGTLIGLGKGTQSTML